MLILKFYRNTPKPPIVCSDIFTQTSSIPKGELFSKRRSLLLFKTEVNVKIKLSLMREGLLGEVRGMFGYCRLAQWF